MLRNVVEAEAAEPVSLSQFLGWRSRLAVPTGFPEYGDDNLPSPSFPLFIPSSFRISVSFW